MEQEKPLSEQESLAIINQMIRRARQGVTDNGFFFLLWGWLVFISAITCYLLIHFGRPQWSGWPWAVLMPLGGIVSIVYGSRKEKQERVKTYTGSIVAYVNIAFGVCLCIILFCLSQRAGWDVAYPMLMMIYGCWLFICGGIMSFRPLIIGGIINWCCAAAGLFLESGQTNNNYYFILLLAFAVLAGYIIPGHMLKAKYDKEKNAV